MTLQIGYTDVFQRVRHPATGISTFLQVMASCALVLRPLRLGKY